MDMAHLCGRTGTSIQDNGSWENKMDWESITLQMGVHGKDCGKKARGFNGIDNLIYTIM